MIGRMQGMFVVALVALLFVTSCCTLSPEPCCDCYDRVKTAQYDLSSDAKQELDKLNTSLANEMSDSIRLNVCNNIMLTQIVVQEIAENIKRSCSIRDLSKKERNDCQSAGCQARLKAEWCAGLTNVLGKHLTSCSQFRYEGTKCEYTEQALRK